MRWWSRAKRTPRRPTRVRGSTSRWGWWFSSDEENYCGPFATRDEALGEALSSECGEDPRCPGVGRFYLLEARQGPVRLSRYVDTSDLLESVCQAIDDEYGGEDGVDWDREWPKSAERRLESWLRWLVWLWERLHGVEVRTWAFTQSRNAERYTWVEGFE